MTPRADTQGVIDSRLLQARLLIVDDEQANVALLKVVLRRAGFLHIRATTDPTQALPLFDEWRPDLVLLDLRMPVLNGFGVLALLRQKIAPTDYVPVLAITGDTDVETRERVLAAGARDFLEKPFRESEVLVRVANLLTTRLLHTSLQEQNERLEQKVCERTVELEVALSDAQAASLAKSRFLATMSHELRTPLNAVIGFSRHLRQNRVGNLTPQDLLYLDRISENGTHLLTTINDILDLSRIEAGKMPVERGPVALDAFLGDIVGKAGEEGAVTGRDLALRALVPPSLPVIHTDELKLRHVVTNLVANALKFTERGAVLVGVRGAAHERSLRVDVVDTGVGIAPQRLGAIFDAFEQEDNSTQRRFGGSGLGLAIARSICRLLGYRLYAVSEPGVGSGFSILLGDGAEVPESYAALVAQYPETALAPNPSH